MGKSKRKNPFMGITTAKSEKQDKRAANRRHRHENKQILNTTLDCSKLKNIRETSDIWDFGKDGKQYFGDMEDKEHKKRLMKK